MKNNPRNGPGSPRDLTLKRVVIMMKLTCLLTCCLVQVVASEAQPRRKVTMHLERATIRDVLAEYQRQTGTIIIYSSDKLETTREVQARFSEVDEETFFDAVLEGSNMSYKLQDDYILIVPAPAVPAAQQEQDVARGRVVDATGQPLPGVTVRVKGTDRGTSTDREGNFRVALPPDAARVLQFSFVGMKPVEVTYAGKELLVAMEETEVEIDEVVVTGLFTRRANSYTGAIASVKGEELRRVGNADLVASLKNIDPAFMVVENLQAGSDPNTLPEIQMRGQTGLSTINSEYQNTPNQPLFILDGFEATLTKILDLDINIIESVTLLKDATAKAIYGSKAANGVVVVETIRPERGQMKFRYTGSAQVQAPDLSSYSLTNSRDKVQAEFSAGLYTSLSATEQMTLTKRYSELLRLVEAGVDTYWLDKPLRVGIGHKHSLYLEGGDDYMLYAVDLAYNGVTGVMRGSNRVTMSGGVTLSYRTKRFIFRNKLSVDGNNAEDSPYGSFSLFARMNPYNVIHDEDGNMVQQYTHGTVVQPNPLWNGEVNTKYASRYTYVTDNLHTEWHVRPNLRLVARFGLSIRSSSTDRFMPSGHTDFFDYTGVSEYSKGKYSLMHREEGRLNGDVGAAWSFALGNHMVFLNTQLSVGQNKYDYYTVQAEGFPNNNMDHITSGVRYSGTRPSGSEGISREAGGMASVNYSYDDRYLFDGNYRLSGSSEFGANKRWGHFYSVGVGWNMHREKFIRDNAGWLDRLKVRASTGYTGSQGFNSYDAIATVAYYTDRQYGGEIGSYLQGLANPNLRWQRRYDTNIGMDISAFTGRVTLRFDCYTADTKGMIADITTPQSMGFASFRANIGEMKNKGYEAYLTLRAWKQRENFANIFFSVASNKNHLSKISNALKKYNETADAAQDADASNTSINVRYQEGVSTTAIWVVQSLGIDPRTGKEVYRKKDGSLTEKWHSSDYINGGDGLPKVSGNMGFNVEYRGLSLSSTFTWRFGGQLYNNTLVSKVENADPRYNVDQRVLESRWSEPGQVTRFKSIADKSYTLPTSRFVEDYNSLTFASMTLSYDFRHREFLARSFLSRLKASFYMNELFILSSVRTERGTDYPFARNFSFSLQANF